MHAQPESDTGGPATTAGEPPARPRGDVWFLCVLLALAGLVALLWFSDPTHSADVKSRVTWPEPEPHKS